MTAFYLPAAPLEDDDLDNALQGMVVGITGLNTTLVRPRWQVNPPKQPEPIVNWCSIGVISSIPDANPVIQHLFGDRVTDPAGDLSIRHEELEVAVSFYGPRAKAYLGAFRDGLYIAQNQESIKQAGLYFVGIDAARTAPDFINQQWIRRWDSSLTFRRMVARVYGINNILAANIHLFDDSGHVDETVVVPPT